MSGSFPTSPSLENVTIKSVTATMVSVAHNMARQVRSRGAVHRWLIEGRLPDNMSRDELAPIMAFLVAQRGRYETFTFTPPVLCDARGTATGTPLVDGADQTGRSIDTKGWTPSITGILAAGDFVKFNGHNKIYMVTADADSDGAGDATISIEPALFESPSDEAAVTVNSVSFAVALVADEAAFSLAGPLYALQTVSMLEDPL